MKTCTRCGQEKEIDSFRRCMGYRGGRCAECKACETERLKQWRASHPDQAKKNWQKGNQARRERGRGISYDPDRRPERQMKARDAYLRRQYGISLDDFNRMYER